MTGLAGDMEAIRAVLTPEQQEQFAHPVAVELKKGEAAFHHPLMIHGSFANSTDRQRRATVLNVLRDGGTGVKAQCAAKQKPQAREPKPQAEAPLRKRGRPASGPRNTSSQRCSASIQSQPPSKSRPSFYLK